jgi:hypothetical protein
MDEDRKNFTVKTGLSGVRGSSEAPSRLTETQVRWTEPLKRRPIGSDDVRVDRLGRRD